MLDDVPPVPEVQRGTPHRRTTAPAVESIVYFGAQHDVVPCARGKPRESFDIEHVMSNKPTSLTAQLAQATSAAAGDVAGGCHAW